MALTPTQIQKRSDEKRGMKVVSFKLPEREAALWDALAQASGKPKNALMGEALQYLAQQYGIDRAQE